MNAPRVAGKMHRRNDDDCLCASDKEDAVREAMNERAP